MSETEKLQDDSEDTISLLDVLNQNPNAPVITLGEGKTGLLAMSANHRGGFLMTAGQQGEIGRIAAPDLPSVLSACLFFVDSDAIDRFVGCLRQLQEAMKSAEMQSFAPQNIPIPASADEKSSD